MDSTGGNNKTTNSGTDHLEKFRRGTVAWSRSREDVWKDIEAGIEKMNRPVPFILRFRYLAAAVILTLAGVSSFLILYTKKYSTFPDQTAEVVLPDGSSIKLSTNTVVSYHPFTWRFSRKVSLDGEAFFDAEKGNKFTVVSDPGITEVLGTTFNILSSENIYEVTCFTGKIKVTASVTGDAVIITRQQKVSLAVSGRLEVESAVNMEESTAWSRGEFFFTSEPLGDVLAKIGRSNGIEIEYEADGALLYTGNFSKEKEIEDILSIVLQPFGLKFEEKAVGEYRVYR